MAGPKRRLRERATFQRRKVVNDGAGNTVGAWDVETPVFRGFAQFIPLNGREQVLADKLTGLRPYNVVIRNCAASAKIDEACRVVRDRTGETYDITNVQPDDDKPVPLNLSILCVKGKADG